MGSVIRTLTDWQQALREQATTIYKTLDDAAFESQYDKFIAFTFSPVLPTNKTSLKRLLQMINRLRFGKPLMHRIKNIYLARKSFDIPLHEFICEHIHPTHLTWEELAGLDSVLVRTGVLKIFNDQDASALRQLLQDMRDLVRGPSGVRVQAKLISAGQNLVIASGDVNIIEQYYKGDQTRLRVYLAGLRATWNEPQLGAISSGNSVATMGRVQLHNLYAPVDIWHERTFHEDDIDHLTRLRIKAVEQDADELRRPILEVVATHPLLVITGGPGTGKSALCRFLATCLSYACDPQAASTDKVDGLALLGPAWIHGAILPLYVNLRNFCLDKENFPKDRANASATDLLAYIKKSSGDFGDSLEQYLIGLDKSTSGTLLLLDGLDEVAQDDQRIIIHKILEGWVDQFPSCRVAITSRTYAYRKDSKWRLSERFASYELAPFTWRQMQRYVENWYTQAARHRPATLGGADIADSRAEFLASHLMKTIIETPSLWPLARQPLLLALLTIIHENNKQLPLIRAELYDKTVELLDRWNIPIPHDNLVNKLANLNLTRVRAAVKLLAFDLHCEGNHADGHPGTIQRKDLLEKLIQQQNQGKGLGASIEDVLDYLGTRNGILVAEQIDIYRFPHLSIQEYLAACALIELYDECKMPKGLQSDSTDGWSFPSNLVSLLKQDPFRWRNVALFAGSIFASEKGQENRWQLIEELLPKKLAKPINEGEMHCIYVAGEIWGETWLKARRHSQIVIRQNLTRGLEAIRNDERLDAPERANTLSLLARMSTIG